MKILTYPLTFEQIKDLKTGDTVYYTGPLFTARDSGHKRMLSDGLPDGVSLSGAALYHAGPIVKRESDGKETVVSAGPTTSRRMESVEADVIEKYEVKLIIGKGGMLEKTASACKEFGAIHCAFPGGCAVVAAERIEEVVDCKWRDLGMPEALWILKVKEFGPLVVSIDTKGDNLFENNRKKFTEKLQKLLNND